MVRAGIARSNALDGMYGKTLRTPALVLALLLLACDADRMRALEPRVTTAEQVIAILGKPSLEWREDDGTRVWEYPRTPEGVVNYLVTIAPDSRFVAIEQVLTEENFNRIKAGMSQDQVRRMLGRPAHERHFSASRETVWDWKTKVEPGMDWYFNVHFDASGVVRRTSASFEPRG